MKFKEAIGTIPGHPSQFSLYLSNRAQIVPLIYILDGVYTHKFSGLQNLYWLRFSRGGTFVGYCTYVHVLPYWSALSIAFSLFTETFSVRAHEWLKNRTISNKWKIFFYSSNSTLHNFFFITSILSRTVLMLGWLGGNELWKIFRARSKYEIAFE